MTRHSQLRWVMLFGAALVSLGALGRGYATESTTTSSSHAKNKAVYPPEKRVDRAVVAVGKMSGDPQISKLLARAKGVLIVPRFVKAAAIVGGQGGDGVLLIRRDNGWSNPAFYDLGGASVGAQLGASAGSMALLLMNDKAVKTFEDHASSWSLDGSVGLTVVEYSAGASKAEGDGDVVIWSDTKGLFGGGAVGVRDIHQDEDADRAYYGDQHVDSRQILTGAVQNPHSSNAKLLKDVLALRVASK